MVSTRANIIISECKVPLSEDKDKIILYHHSDGFPGGVGSELVDFLREFNMRLKELNDLQSNSSAQVLEWTPENVAEFITDRDMSYRRVTGVTDAAEYIYIIDTTKKRLSCHAADGCIDLDCLGDRIEIDGNVFDGRQTELKIEPNYADMFRSCSCVKEFDGKNIIFQDGTMMPTTAIPAHVPPIPAPRPQVSYVQADEMLDTYKKIFLTVMPTILRRESYPFNFDRIVDLANEITVRTMRQFTKMKEYYLQQI